MKWLTRLTGARGADAAVVLVCLFLTALAVKTPWSPLPRPVILLAGAVGSVAQWQRRRWPLVAAVLGAASYPLSGNPGPWLVGLFSGAAHARRGRVWFCAVLGWVAFGAFQWIDAGRPGAFDAFWAAVATALVVVAGVYVATRRTLLESVRDRAEQAEAGRLLREEQARTAERARIAHEMHDVLAHKVSLIALHAGALELGAGTEPGRVSQVAGLIRVTAREALQELRTVLGVLHGAEAPGPGAPFADLAALVQESTRAGQRVELRDGTGPLPPATARVVYRVAQEGLTNAHRYAPQAPTTVTVDRADGGGVTVTVHNARSAGAATDLPGSGSGLVGLAERIRLVGGSLHSGPIGPAGRDGWQLRAVVPWLDPS
jgi:signal transduction histidine kinase